MKALLLFISFYSLISCSVALGQKKDWITVVKLNGDSIQLKTKLYPYESNQVFVDDSESFIKGYTKNQEKIKLPKSEIKTIILMNKPVYEVFPNGSKSIIGYFSTKGRIKIFESFELGTQIFTSGPIPNNGYGSNTNYQQVVNKKHWEFKTGMLVKVDINKRIDQLSKKCPALSERMRVFKSLRTVYYGVDNINYYNQVCASENPSLIEPSKLILFRKKGGQKDVMITVFVNGEQFNLSRNSFETKIIENAINVKICTDNEENCIIKTFSTDRTNFVEISLRKKESQTKIDYVESSYGALETRWIRESMK